MDTMQSKADELFFVVDDHNQPLEPLRRKQVHGTGIWHRVAHIWLVNGRDQVLCQQRALNKELNPGFWEPFFGGHLKPGEEVKAAALRELREELGITAELTFWQTYQFSHPSGYNNEFQAIFVAHWDGKPTDVTFDDGEVAQVVWRPIAEVRDIIAAYTPNWTHCGYEVDLLSALINKEII